MPATSARPARLRRLLAPVVAAALALVPAACDLDGRDPSAPDIIDQWVIAEEPAPAAGTPPNVELQAGVALIGVSGDFVRTCTEGLVRVTHAFDGSNLTLRATFTPAASCAQSTPTRQYVRYFAYLTRVPAGTYQVRVIHENDDLVGGTGTALQQTLVVP